MKSNQHPVALVTGAGRGLGASLAHALEQDGWTVVRHYHQTRPRIKAPGLTVQADLANDSGSRKVIRFVKDKCGRLDLLINNSGVYHPVPLVKLSQKQWFEGLNTTASAVFFMTRHALPLLRRTQGRVINIGDSSASRPGARDLSMSYHIGKTGVGLLTKSFARQEAPRGVTVNMVSPGYLDNSVGLPDLKEIPAGRYGCANDIYSVIRFLTSRESAYVTGTDIVVSGGWNL